MTRPRFTNNPSSGLAFANQSDGRPNTAPQPIESNRSLKAGSKPSTQERKNRKIMGNHAVVSENEFGVKANEDEKESLERHIEEEEDAIPVSKDVLRMREQL